MVDGRRFNGNKPGSPNTKYLTQNLYHAAESRPEEISKALGNAMMFAGDFVFDKNNTNVVSTITPISSPEECADRLNWFFKTCQDTGQLPTIEKMYLALGIYRQRASNWEYRGTNKEIVAMIEKARSIISSMDAELASNGVLNTVCYIFRAKNFYGMRDQVDIQASTVTQEDEHKLVEEKYKDVIDVDAKEKDIIDIVKKHSDSDE